MPDRVDPIPADTPSSLLDRGIMVSPPRTKPPAEPWSFRFLGVSAWAVLIVGVVQFALVAMLATGPASRLGSGPDRTALLDPRWLVGSGLVMMGSLLASAASHVLLDVARGLRSRRSP